MRLKIRSQIGVVAAFMLSMGVSAYAQDASTNSSSNSSTTSPVLGPPALKDFQLEPRERLVVQPPPEARPPAPEVTQQPTRQQPEPVPRPRLEAEPAEAPRSASDRPAPPAASDPSPAAGSDAAPPIAIPPGMEATPRERVPVTTPAAPTDEGAPRSASGPSWYVYAAPLALLLLLGIFGLRRRRDGQAEPVEEAAPVEEMAPPVVAAPRQPILRPWLEVDLKAQRASFTETEWVVQFELSVANTGQVPATNVKIDVMLFNAGKEQDKEIGAFFRTAGRESTKLALPSLDAGRTGVIDGEVAMPLAEMRGMKLANQTMFIPVVAVNALYDWGEDGQDGQTAKSYIVGRELQEPSEKMGAFRVDLGPRIWRTVGQRPHKLARRF